MDGNTTNNKYQFLIKHHGILTTKSQNKTQIGNPDGVICSSGS